MLLERIDIMPPKIPREILIKDLQRVAKKLNRSPLVTEYENLGKYSSITIRKEFGSWSNAIKSIGLNLSPKHRVFWENKDLQDELIRLETMLGHKPAYRELKKYSKISPDTFARRIGKSDFTDPMNPTLSTDWDVNLIPEDTGNWISGFTTGEGCFVFGNGNATFSISQRSDDIDILITIGKIMDLPSYPREYSNQYRRNKGEKAGDDARLFTSNRWVIYKRVIPFFTRFPLKGRKALEFNVFKEAIEFMCQRDKDGRHKKRYTKDEKEKISQYAKAIKSLRHDPTSLLKD